jgi:protein-disulfide isomerase
VFAAIVLSTLAVLFSGLALLFATGMLDGTRPVSSSFEAQARQYLLQNPEIVVDALQRLEDQRHLAEANELQTLIAERRDDIFNDAAAPTAGNPEGDVALVEFFDYNCPYCRKAAPDMALALKDDPNLKLVFKEWPILGPGSEFAAKAALASHKQGKYEAFHHALMGFPGRVSESSTLTIAGDVGLDVEQLKRDMEDPTIAEAISRNRALANDLRITGTPTFVVGDEIIRGMVDLAVLKRFIAEARDEPEG